MYLFKILAEILFPAAFFVPPLAALVWFGISVDRYRRTPKEDTEERRKKKRTLIISAITAAVINGALITIIILLLIGISHM